MGVADSAEMAVEEALEIVALEIGGKSIVDDAKIEASGTGEQEKPVDPGGTENQVPNPGGSKMSSDVQSSEEMANPKPPKPKPPEEKPPVKKKQEAQALVNAPKVSYAARARESEAEAHLKNEQARKEEDLKLTKARIQKSQSDDAKAQYHNSGDGASPFVNAWVAQHHSADWDDLMKAWPEFLDHNETSFMPAVGAGVNVNLSAIFTFALFPFRRTSLL